MSSADQVVRRQQATRGGRYHDLQWPPVSKDLPPKIRQAVRYIERFSQQKLTLPRVATRVGYHPNYLCQRFRDEVGVSFADFLTGTRLKHAIKGLVYTDDPIKEVGYRAGFGGPAQFSTVFRRWMACSPRAFRTRYRYGNFTGSNNVSES